MDSLLFPPLFRGGDFFEFVGLVLQATVEVRGFLIFPADAFLMVLVVFGFGLFFGHLVRDSAGVFEDVSFVKLQECVEAVGPVLHGHGDTSHGLAFSVDKVLFNQVVQRGQLLLIEVVLGDGDIVFADFIATPVGQAHVGFGVVGPLVDYLGGRLAGDGPVELVLDGLEEGQAYLLGGVVIDGGSVYVGNFLVESPLGGANVLYATQELVEVVEWLVRVLEPLVVHSETLDDVFGEALGGPDAKAGGNVGFHPVADGDDHVEVIILQFALNLSATLLPN